MLSRGRGERRQKEGNAGTVVVFPTSIQQGGGWKRTTRGSLFRVRGSDALQVFSLPPKSRFFYFTFSCHYKENLPIKRTPTWRPLGLELISCFSWRCHSLTDPVLFYSKEASGNMHHFLCASSVFLFRKLSDGSFKCLRYCYGNQYSPSILE